MTPYYSDSWLTVFHGDCRAVMAEMEPESVHCVVTSPPYWGLRDYGTATWEGGEAGCDHRSPTMREGRNEDRATLGGGVMATNSAQLLLAARTGCGKCGATRIDAQLGLEPTPEEYVANLVAVFREVRRVLRKDGTVWLNLGDSYVANSTGSNGNGTEFVEGMRGPLQRGLSGRVTRAPGLKHKDLVGIPWRVAFALQADGWYLRSEIIWSKPNPMPESVTDRPTKSHETIFLLSKSARYFWDADAVREDRPANELAREARGYRNVDANPAPGLPPGASPHTGLHKAAWPGRERNVGGRSDGFTRMPGGEAEWAENGRAGRNIRSVWNVATAPYPGSHFATFPPKLIEPCIKAGTSERGVCPECGEPWRRIVAYTKGDEEASERPKHTQSSRSTLSLSGNGSKEWAERGSNVETTGWQAWCVCRNAALDHHDPIPAIVLDPFAGSGTTGMVAQSLSRRAVLIDLSLDYLGQLMDRNADIPLGLGA